GTATLRLELGEVPPLPLRPQAIARALGNLLENARKYGGGEIEAGTRMVDGEAWVEIMDRGPGIPPEQVERLKRPFTRLEGARSNATGTGLGLAIVERIARQHGGRLELLPREGGGLRARLCLPLAAQRDRKI
ncbi:MAG: ATP-binding protein, partial [Proteobacteria bacterium]|nr:ATP-binding protein [Pseudomonadota bacterium]